MGNKQKLITVQEYCRLNNVSVQSVYARIKRGTLEAVVENGVKMILNDYATQDTTQSEPEVNSELNVYTTLLQSTIKDQKKEIKRLHKTIKDLEKQRLDSMDAVLSILSGKVVPMQIENNPFSSKGFGSDGFIDAEVKTKKKKSKKRKKKK